MDAEQVLKELELISRLPNLGTEDYNKCLEQNNFLQFLLNTTSGDIPLYCSFKASFVYSVVADGPIAGSKEAHFAFLGVYSGEPYLQEKPIEFDDITITRKYSFNLGAVWYAELVVDVVNKGVTYSCQLHN